MTHTMTCESFVYMIKIFQMLVHLQLAHICDWMEAEE